MKLQKYFTLALGPILFIITLFLFSFFNYKQEGQMAAIAIWIATWWLTEAVEMPVTSLLPIILIPIFGIADAKTIASQYMDQVIFLFMGGFMLSYALEKSNLHTRLALFILSKVGNKPQNILAGIMLTAFFISMWMSNTATVMMLYAAVIAIVVKFKESVLSHNQIGASLMIGLAYASSIGGMATLVGTPTNMIFYSFYNSQFEHQNQLVFSTWFMLAFPIALLLAVVTFFCIRHHFKLQKIKPEINEIFFTHQYKSLGSLSRDEKIVGLIFILTAFLWFSRSDIVIGNFYFKGWSNLFLHKDYIQDSTVAILMASVLFFIPSCKNSQQTLLSWEDCKKLPFGIMLLFGSGFALAKGFELSGLSNLLAQGLHILGKQHFLLITIGMCILITFISEFASNVASIQLALPILLALSVSLNFPAISLMIPATLAASLGFMLPVATAPNTIVYGSGLIKAKDMYSIGLWVNIAGVILISIICYAFCDKIFHVNALLK
jgi:sodium-dependent dicarboxylate transporter 2/3/5